MSLVYALNNTNGAIDSIAPIKSSKLVSSVVMSASSKDYCTKDVSCADYLETVCTWIRYIAIDIWDEWGDPETNSEYTELACSPSIMSSNN